VCELFECETAQFNFRRNVKIMTNRASLILNFEFAKYKTTSLLLSKNEDKVIISSFSDRS
jgi:hypothetical protein